VVLVWLPADDSRNSRGDSAHIVGDLGEGQPHLFKIALSVVKLVYIRVVRES
jgi:hypothetical protein